MLVDQPKATFRAVYVDSNGCFGVLFENLSARWHIKSIRDEQDVWKFYFADIEMNLYYIVNRGESEKVMKDCQLETGWDKDKGRTKADCTLTQGTAKHPRIPQYKDNTKQSQFKSHVGRGINATAKTKKRSCRLYADRPSSQ